MHRSIPQLVIVLLVWAALCLPMLDSGGLTMTEGHRALPGWEMVRTGDWLVPTMFEQPYLRKPPGIAWATGVSAMLLGETVLSARLVSALSFAVCALAAWWFARRWFGAKAGLAGGLAMLLMPWLWTAARHAEIEALLLAGTSVGAFALLDRLVARPRALGIGVTVLGALGWTVAMLAKGPAALPVLAGIVAAACAARRSWKPLISPAHLAAQLVPAGALGLWMLLTARALDARGETAVTQSPGAFLFEAGWVLDALAFAPSALLAMLPAALAMLFPWGPDARTEANADGTARARCTLARAIAGSTLLALLVLQLTGITNPRYAMPAAVLPPMLVAWVAGMLAGGGLTQTRAKIARAMLLGRGPVMAGVLLVGGWVWMGTLEARSRATSGQDAGTEAGLALAEAAGGRAVQIWADDAIEARPEVLEWLVRAAGQAGTDVRARWIPGGEPGDWAATPDGPDAVLVRLDPQSPEHERTVNLGNPSAWREVVVVQAHKYRFGVFMRRQTRESVVAP